MGMPKMLKKTLYGWLLVAGMVLYAIALTAIHAGRTVADQFSSLRSEQRPSATSQ